MPKVKPETATVVEQEQQPSRLELLEAFADLVAEGFGYKTAKRLTQKDMSEKTQAEGKKAREAAKAVAESMETLIKAPTQETAKKVITARETLKDARKVVSEARKPFNEKMKPLASAVKYIDSVAIPDSLKELGKTVQPLFKLSTWAEKAVEQTKKKKQ